MEQKIFTLEEANRILPKLTKDFRAVFFLNSRIKIITSDIKDLIDIWGEDLFDRRHVDNNYYKSLIRKRRSFVRTLQQAVEKIHDHGCMVKDVENGLVDFYAERGGDLVLLCWRYGEHEIKYWHTLDGGFANRRHIRELVQRIV